MASTNAGFPTPSQLVDKVPLIKNPGFWIPKPVELPPDIHPLPEDVHAYFVYPHTLEAHVLSTLPSALSHRKAQHTQRLALLASYAESKERARKARLNQVAPGWDEGGKALMPVQVRRETVVPAKEEKRRRETENLMGGSDDEAAADREDGRKTPTRQGSLLRGGQYGSPKEMGQDTMDQMQRDQLKDMFEGLEKLDTSLGSSANELGRSDVDDLI
ncbi:hypothetical protein NBRC10512_007172 [Rhodotorula toruloides]|uniref:RHTO0S01e07118g1_1 n=2 Tax=Rhodotorula toruloides TaxID=5286 RepID=A0A061AKE0_RHOTO|nr:uncharacterized protein RHTO_01372 [Rhodotorula toruloides NP11]EMS21725.1 hypothetical protein RHTO_01372 [Rhodotorula toruloides NP11]CDR35788.1 RHTO0S01e07118g1_1 [Rhodotorula toruloides]